jgi:AcrR family transcriptional regulator
MAARDAAGRTLRERNQERTRTDVVRAALDIISAEGADRMTIDRIASEAGMSRGTLYAHYPEGQDEIVRAAYDRLGADVLAAAAAGAERGTDWIDRLAAYAEAMVELARDPELGFFYNISGPSRVGLNREGGTGSSGTRDAFRAELEAARDEGLIPDDVDPAATASLLVGMVRQAGIDVARDSGLAPGYLAAFRRTLVALGR